MKQRGNRVRHVPLYRRWRWAAAVLLLLAGSAWLYTITKNNEKPGIAQQQGNSSDILPGTNKALLTLSDGTVIALDSAANGAIAQQGNASVIKLANGGIQYDVKGAAADKVMMNTMTTPNGGQHQLVLPDGTKIWLNAASSVTYPTAFAGNERKIKVNGEVYLEVAKDAHKPFLVDVAGKSTVQVLGTSFNINAYADEGNIKTTLVEGSVRVIDVVKAIRGGRFALGVTLRPGQQAMMANNEEDILIQPANINRVLAWKNGYINFESGSFDEVMRQIERWYDIEIKIEGTMPPISIEGRIDKGVHFSDLMDMLNNFGVHTRLEGRTLVLSKK